MVFQLTTFSFSWLVFHSLKIRVSVDCFEQPNHAFSRCRLREAINCPARQEKRNSRNCDHARVSPTKLPVFDIGHGRCQHVGYVYGLNFEEPPRVNLVDVLDLVLGFLVDDVKPSGVLILRRLQHLWQLHDVRHERHLQVQGREWHHARRPVASAQVFVWVSFLRVPWVSWSARLHRNFLNSAAAAAATLDKQMVGPLSNHRPLDEDTENYHGTILD